MEDTVHRRSGPPAGRWLNSWQHRTDNLHDLLFWRIRAKPHVRTRKDDCSFLTDTGVRTHTRKQNRPAQAPSLARSAHKFARSLGSLGALARLGPRARSFVRLARSLGNTIAGPSERASRFTCLGKVWFICLLRLGEGGVRSRHAHTFVPRSSSVAPRAGCERSPPTHIPFINLKAYNGCSS